MRFDLTMDKKAEPSTRCTCLDVLVGRPSDPGFVWIAEPPELDPDQVVVAIRTQGASCPAGTPRLPFGAHPSELLNASTVTSWSKSRSCLRAGRSRSALLPPQPAPGGSMVLRPANRRLPYGAPAGSGQLCRIFARAGSGVRP